MPHLVRDNAADESVIADLERLAAAYDDEAVVGRAARVGAATAADLELLAATYAGEARPGANAWSTALTHLNRYRTLYIVATAVLALVLFRSPVPPPATVEAEATTELPTGDATPVAPPPAAPVAPATDDAAFVGPLDLGAPDELASPLDPATVATPAASKAAPAAVLRIAQSGYASAFGGTALEAAPPENGLPVELLAGGVTKESYVRLAGNGRTLKLRMLTADGASLNDPAARVQACRITTPGWTASRGGALADAPKHDTAGCVEAARDAAGMWTFAFVLDAPTGGHGWALVPVTSGNGTFRVTFSATAT